MLPLLLLLLIVAAVVVPDCAADAQLRSWPRILGISCLYLLGLERRPSPLLVGAVAVLLLGIELLLNTSQGARFAAAPPDSSLRDRNGPWPMLGTTRRWWGTTHGRSSGALATMRSWMFSSLRPPICANPRGGRICAIAANDGRHADGSPPTKHVGDTVADVAAVAADTIASFSPPPQILLLLRLRLRILRTSTSFAARL